MDGDAAFEAKLTGGDVTFDARDAALLRAIDAHGSINAAASALGRSYSRAQQRVVALEDAFGDLVHRERGGSGGGGSTLTARANELLGEFDRLRREFQGVASTSLTVFTGRVTDRDGELASIVTDAGTVRAVVPREEAGGETAAGREVEVWVRSDAVTLTDPADTPEPGETSARNRFAGVVTDVDAGETIAEVRVDVGLRSPLTALVTQASVETLALAAGTDVVASFKATATRGKPRDA